MQEVVRNRRWVNRFDEVDRDLQLKQILARLENENSLLKSLVVRLSAMVIRTAAAKR